METTKTNSSKMIALMKKKYAKEQRGDKYLYTGLLLNLLLVGERLLFKLIPSSYNASVYISSLYYSMIILSLMFFLPSIHPLGKIKIKSYITGLCIAGSFIYIAINYGVGVILKNIAANPYDLSIRGIITNLLTQLPKTIALIMVTSFSVNTVNKKTRYSKFWTVVLVIYITCLQVNFTKLSIIRSFEDLFIFLAQDVLPKISLSVLMTVICLIGGSTPCICYMGIIRVFQFIFPFLPSLPWIGESVTGIAYPVILSMFIWEEYKILSGQKPPAQKENIFSFSAWLTFLVAFSWFVVGVFSIYPSVILTGSMEPVIYPGDVILIRKLTKEEEVYKLKEGDIITFKLDNISITHRIKEVKSDEAGNLSFVTKGDNNDSEDSWLVLPNDLKGTVKNVLPKVGLPVLWIRDVNNIPEGVISY